MSSSLEGRVAVVFGVANKRSIAWSIAQGLHHAGAKLAITYQNERLERRPRISFFPCPARKGSCVTFPMMRRSSSFSANLRSAMASCMFWCTVWPLLLRKDKGRIRRHFP